MIVRLLAKALSALFGEPEARVARKTNFSGNFFFNPEDFDEDGNATDEASKTFFSACNILYDLYQGKPLNHAAIS